MADGNPIDMETLVESSVELRASMEKFLDSELKYIDYLRNRDKFYIGIKNISGSALLMQEEEEQQRFVNKFFFPNFKPPKKPKNPVKDPQPVTIPVWVFDILYALGYTLEQLNAMALAAGITLAELIRRLLSGLLLPQPGFAGVPGGELIPNVNIATADAVDGKINVTDPGEVRTPSEVDVYNEELVKGNLTATSPVDAGSYRTPEQQLVYDQELAKGNIIEETAKGVVQGIVEVPVEGDVTTSIVKGPEAETDLTVEGLKGLSTAQIWEIVKANLSDPWLWAMITVGVGLSVLDGPAPFGEAGGIGLVMFRLTQLLQKGKLIIPKAVKLAPALALASGGVVASPTRALIGEGGEAEVVLPLSKIGDALEAVYREGGATMVAATQSFLRGNSSPGARTVLTDANRLQNMLGTSSFQVASVNIPNNLFSGLTEVISDEYSSSTSKSTSFNFLDLFQKKEKKKEKKTVVKQDPEKLKNVVYDMLYRYEDIREAAYQDTEGIWTIGKGATYIPGWLDIELGTAKLVDGKLSTEGRPVRQGDILNKEQIMKLSAEDYNTFYDRTSSQLAAVGVDILELPLHVSAPLISAAYNYGSINSAHGGTNTPVTIGDKTVTFPNSLAEMVAAGHKSGDYSKIADLFEYNLGPLDNKGDLINRRRSEANIIRTGTDIGNFYELQDLNLPFTPPKKQIDLSPPNTKSSTEIIKDEPVQLASRIREPEFIVIDKPVAVRVPVLVEVEREVETFAKNMIIDVFGKGVLS